jgi:hypothetical protein
MEGERAEVGRGTRTLGDQMPPRRIQGVVLSPGNIRAVCGARAVLVDVSRAKFGLPV